MRKAVFLLTLCCILRHVLGAGDGACVDMWCGFTGKEYKFFFHNLTFYKAQEVCRAKEGDLATVKNRQVYEFLIPRISRYDLSFWVGERLIKDKQHYEWVDGETHTTDSISHAIKKWDWSGNIGCVQTINGDRQVKDCTEEVSFVCERLGNRCMNSNGNCSQICTHDGNNDKKCACSWGYKLQADGRSCTDINECVEKKHPCKNGVCRNHLHGYTCSCKPGFYPIAPYHCYDIDECNSNHGRGPCHQKCENSVGSYRCLCDEGFIELNKTHCKPLNKCMIGNGGCQHKCHFDPSRNTRKCTCYTGYKAINETNCRDLDECEPNNGGCPKRCVNTVGSFVCREHEPVNCDENNGRCDHTCVANSHGVDTCTCKEGYALVETTRCERIGRAEADDVSFPWRLAAACIVFGIGAIMLLGLLIWKKRNREPVQNP